METEKEYLRERRMSAIICESNGEYTLPDYNTDVKRVLCVSAKAVPSSKFMDGEMLECVGIVAYEVVYLDSENNVTHCCFTTDYELKIKCNSETYKDAHITTRVKNYTIRPIGPRRFSAKCVLNNMVCVSEKAHIGIGGDAFSYTEPEVATETVHVGFGVYSAPLETEYAETLIEVEGAIADEVDVLTTSGAVKNLTTSVKDDGVDYKGEIEVKALVLVEDDLPKTVSVTIPIQGSISFDEIEDGMDLDVDVIITSLSTSVNAMESGVVVTVSVITEAALVGRANESIRLITDSFICDRGTENEYTNSTFMSHAGSMSEQFNIDLEFDRSELGAQNLRNVIYSDGVCSLSNATIEGDGIKLEGEMRLSVMACEINDDGEPTFVGLKLDIPFATKVKNSCQNSNITDVYADLCLVSNSVTLDADKIYVMACIDVGMQFSASRNVRYVTSSVLTDEVYESVGADVVVYYPDSGESLFDVARSFHTSLLKLASDNSLTESAFRTPDSSSSLAGVRKLIIK